MRVMEVKGKLKIFPDRPDQDRRVRSRQRLLAQCPECVEQGVAAPSSVRNEVWCEGLCWKHARERGLKPPPSRAPKSHTQQKKCKKSAQQSEREPEAKKYNTKKEDDQNAEKDRKEDNSKEDSDEDDVHVKVPTCQAEWLKFYKQYLMVKRERAEFKMLAEREGLIGRDLKVAVFKMSAKIKQLQERIEQRIEDKYVII